MNPAWQEIEDMIRKGQTPEEQLEIIRQLVIRARRGEMDRYAIDLYDPPLNVPEPMRGLERIVPRAFNYYTNPQELAGERKTAQEMACLRGEFVKALQARADPIERELAAGTAAPEQQLSPIPCPGKPWWIGTEQDWQKFTDPLIRQGCCALDSNGKPEWKLTAGLAGIVARAAMSLSRSGKTSWLLGNLGEESYPEFLRSHFVWPKGIPKSKNAFDRSHASSKDIARAEAILPAYGFEPSEIEALLKIE